MKRWGVYLQQLQSRKIWYKQKIENSRNAEGWVLGQKVFIAQIDGVTHVRPCFCELHSLCREASRIGACCSILVPACLITFTGCHKPRPGTAWAAWNGLKSSHGRPCLFCASPLPRHASFLLNPNPNQCRRPSISASPAQTEASAPPPVHFCACFHFRSSV